jgi:hypothetical protein
MKYLFNDITIKKGIKYDVDRKCIGADGWKVSHHKQHFSEKKISHSFQFGALIGFWAFRWLLMGD